MKIMENVKYHLDCNCYIVFKGNGSVLLESWLFRKGWLCSKTELEMETAKYEKLKEDIQDERIFGYIWNDLFGEEEKAEKKTVMEYREPVSNAVEMYC